MRIFIGGLTDGNITAADLQSRLQPYAAVEAIDLHSNFAHITLNPISDSHWKKFLNQYNGTKWKGGVLRIEKARPDYSLRLAQLSEQNRQIEEDHRRRAEKQRRERLRYQPCSLSYPLARMEQPLTDKHCRGRKFWKRMNNGRPVRVMRLRDASGQIRLIDPTALPNRIFKFRDYSDDQPVRLKMALGGASSNIEVAELKFTNEVKPSTAAIAEPVISIMDEIHQFERQQPQESIEDSYKKLISTDDLLSPLAVDVVHSVDGKLDKDEQIDSLLTKERSIVMSILSQMDFLHQNNSEHATNNETNNGDDETQSKIHQEETKESKRHAEEISIRDEANGRFATYAADIKDLFFGSTAKSSFALFAPLPPEGATEERQTTADCENNVIDENSSVIEVEDPASKISEMAAGEEDGIMVAMHFNQQQPTLHFPTTNKSQSGAANTSAAPLPVTIRDQFDGAALRRNDLKLFFPHDTAAVNIARDRLIPLRPAGTLKFGSVENTTLTAADDAQQFWEENRKFFTGDYKQRHKYAVRMHKKQRKTRQ